MDVTNIGAYTDFYTEQYSSSSKLKESMSATDYSKATEEELLGACKEFEAYFLEQVLKGMQKTVDCFKDEDETSNYSDSMLGFFKDQTLESVAKESTETNGLGLAQTLYEQMKRNYSL